MAQPSPLLQILNPSAGEGSAPNWPALVGEGLARSAFAALAVSLALSERQLATALGVALPPKANPVLSLDASEGVYRAAAALAELQTKTNKATPACAAWLASPSALLKGRIPMELLKTSIGCEYVATAIARL